MKTRNKIISGLLVLLGFSGCEFIGDDIEPGPDWVMYGPGPVSGYTVKGKVTDADEKPIEGIRVVIRPTDPEALPGYVNDTIYTDADGIYRSRSDIDIVIPGLTAAAADVDGPANGGEFLAAESEITIEDYKGKDSDGFVIVKSFVLDKKVETDDEER